MKTIDETRNTLKAFVAKRKAEGVELVAGMGTYNVTHDGRCFACLLGCVVGRRVGSTFRSANILDIDVYQSAAIESGFENWVEYNYDEDFPDWYALGAEFREFATEAP